MTRIPPDDDGGLDFGPGQMPQYMGPPAPGWPKEFDPDCCTQPDCPQRDYNRACILALEKLSVAYAALLNLRWATGRVWPCEAGTGHTEDCDNPSCTFGRDLDVLTARAIRNYAQVVHEVGLVLTTTSVDLTPQWQDFTDIEQMWVGLDATKGILPNNWLDALRQEVVGLNDVEYARWFRPPGRRRGPPG